MKTISKAWDCWYTWSDYAAHGPYDMVYADTASQARARFNISAEGDAETFLEVRCRRNPGLDLVCHLNPSPILDTLTADQIRLMDHAIGGDYQSAEPYRNRYQCPKNPTWDDIVSKGLAVFQVAMGLPFYHLTQLGIEVMQSANPILRRKYEAVTCTKQSV